MSNALTVGTKDIEANTRAQVARGRGERGDYAIATVCVSVLVLTFVLLSKSLWHWYLLPVMACGILGAVDIVRWLRGRLDLFDPKTIIACIAFYGFFVAPILNVVWDTYGVGDLTLWGDWRPWLGAMACLNVLGLLAYRSAHNFAFSRSKPSATRWNIDRKRFYPVFAFALVSSITGVIAFLWQFGGITGTIEAYESNREVFAGKGWLLVLAWPLAILSSIVLVFARTDRERKPQRHIIATLLLLSLAGIGHFVLLGWYGNRSATIWALFWMAGIVHYRFRSFSPKLMAGGLISLIAFMYFYGFYKEQGRTGLEILRSPSQWLEPKGYQRNLKYLLLGDLARADSNAFILHNLMKDPQDYHYRWGLTYAGAFTILIPHYFWPDRPYIRVDAGSEALWGKAAQVSSTRLYGLGGEALLNFGPSGVAPIFALYGGLLGWYRRKLNSWDRVDARMFLAPFLTSMLVKALVYDSDVLVFFVATEGTLASVALFISSRRSRP